MADGSTRLASISDHDIEKNYRKCHSSKHQEGNKIWLYFKGSKLYFYIRRMKYNEKIDFQKQNCNCVCIILNLQFLSIFIDF